MAIFTKSSCNVTSCLPAVRERSFLKTFVSKDWKGLAGFSGRYLWTDGTDIYYNGTKILNRETGEFESKAWNNLPKNFYGDRVWSDGEDIYYSEGSIGEHYILNKATDTWELLAEWADKGFYGSNIWTDGVNTYMSGSSATSIFDKATRTWSTKGWSIAIDPRKLWTDGEKLYHSVRQSSTSGLHHVYNRELDDWEPITWNDNVNPSGWYIWTDGRDVFYTLDSATQYVLNREAMVWEETAFKGQGGLNGEYFWSDGTHIYYSTSNGTVILLPTTAKLYSRIGSAWEEAGWPIGSAPISFTIVTETGDTHTCTARDGMCWGEYVYSAYNTDTYYSSEKKLTIVNGYPRTDTTDFIYDSDSNYVSDTDIIIAGATYLLGGK